MERLKNWLAVNAAKMSMENFEWSEFSDRKRTQLFYVNKRTGVPSAVVTQHSSLKLFLNLMFTNC